MSISSVRDTQRRVGRRLDGGAEAVRNPDGPNAEEQGRSDPDARPRPDAAIDGAPKKYHAFMSYSHAADGKLAPALQDALHAKEFLAVNHAPVFFV